MQTNRIQMHTMAGGAMICTVIMATLLALWSMGNSTTSLNRFSTKTAYRNHGLKPPAGRDAELTYLRTCQPLHVSGLYRHGTRQPSLKDIVNANKIHTKLLASKSAKGYLPPGLAHWSNSFVSEEAKDLTLVGQEELTEMGKRIAHGYGSRLTGGQGFTLKNSRFISSDTQRSTESGRKFIRGLLPEVDNDAKADEVLQINNRLLRFFDFCPRFIYSVDQNKTALIDFHNFKKGPKIAAVVERVRSRFHLDDIELKPDDMQVIFAICASELAANITEQSPWCEMFSEEDMDAVEYLYDLKHYWRKAYGYRVNYLQSCPLVASMMEHIENAAKIPDNNEDTPRGVFYFAHAETVLPVVAQLGLFNQSEAPRANNYQKYHHRLFRTSNITPFGANVALVLYRCSSQDSYAESLYVQPLINEQPVEWPLCGDKTYCSLAKFSHYFGSCHASKFDFHTTCAFEKKDIPPTEKNEL